MKAPLWRLATDYVGAGKYLVDADRVIVGTPYGVHCVPRSRAVHYAKSGAHGAKGSAAEGGKVLEWKAELGSRAIGLVAGHDGKSTVAACVEGLFGLSEAGEERWGTHTFRQLVYAPVPYQDGYFVTTNSSIHFVREWSGSEWRFDFGEVLGSSVEAVRLLNLFHLDGHVVVGVVDYDSGIGRVVVLDGKTGRHGWMSDPGPVSELFPAGQAVFVWSQTGYGKFETRMSRIDGHDIWQRDFAGLGVVRPDGSLAMVVGSNESPAWDDWEYRQVSAAGKEEVVLKGKGRCAVRPIVRKDGTIYFLGAVLPIDIAGSRIDYTSFFAMPQEILFQHVMGIRTQLPEYDVTLHRHRPGEKTLDTVYQVSGSFSLAELQFDTRQGGHEPSDGKAPIILGDGQDLIAVEG